MMLRAWYEAIEGRVRRLNDRDRRALVLAVWVLLPTVGYVRVVRPVLTNFANARDEVATERDLLSREQALLDDAGTLPARAAAEDSMLSALRPRLFPGEDPVAASAGLARYVTGRAASHHVLVQGSETQPPSPTGAGFMRLAVDVRAAGDLRGLVSWLQDLETGSRLVRVEELRIIPADRIGAEEGVDEEVLGVTLRVSGFSGEPSRDSGAVAMRADR